MPRITEFFIIETAAQNALIVNASVAEKDLPKFIGEGFNTIGAYVKKSGIMAADTPFLHITGFEFSTLNVIVGIPVAAAAHGVGDIQSFVIPGGPKVFCYYQGDNSKMAPVYEEMSGFAKKQGYTMDKAGVYEYFLNGPDHGADKLLTKMVGTLKK